MSESNIEAKGEMQTPDMWKPQKKELLIMVSLSFISLMVALDATILVTVLPVIAQKLNGTAAEAFWTGTSYLLTSAIFQPVIASVSAVFGRQQLLITSLLFFTTGTILCSVADNFTTLLGGRCIQGIGGGGIITLTQVIFCDIVPLRQRPKYFSMVLGCWSIGSIVGPVVGGKLVESTTWRWAFHINYPFCGIGFIVAIFFVHLDATSKLTFQEKLKRVDWLGAMLFIGSMTSLLIGISWGGIQHPWDSAATLAPIIAGLVGIALFFLWQVYRKEHTLLPLAVFGSWSAIAAFYNSLINGLLLFTTLYYWPFYDMSVRGRYPTQAGVDMLPVCLLTVPSSVAVSVLTSRLGRFRWAIWGGWVITTLACGLQILLDVDSTTVITSVFLAVLGIGMGMVLTSLNVGIQAISKPEDAAMAASMYGFLRSLGMPLGVALAGTIFSNSMSDKLSELGLPTSIAHDSEQYIFVLRTMADSPQKSAILSSYMKGFDSVFIMTTAVSASALVVSLIIRKYSMDKILLAQFSAR
ncbi:MFS general substrate transporter [Alternaria alternata]|uniref:MFS general substrate transporter n=2 Tax=Alternaria sect. Alternaria TaxID=2499237 RepID=A0A177DY52_ALTAL|nr:MFS general substrate transporter [Alternaria alternata]KAH6859278.1 major facilitator superfamily domain-containing protein [Alternaria alternata]OAG23912.1 MFS general substrate transporter [Alternaria alternata]